MKKLILVWACLFLMVNNISAADSAGTSPNTFNSNPDLEMYGQNIKGVNRVESNRVLLSGAPQSISDGVPKSYIDQNINFLGGEIYNLKLNLNNSFNKLTGQISLLLNNMNTLSNQVNSFKKRVVSLQSRITKLENKPPPSCPECQTNHDSSGGITQCPTIGKYSYQWSRRRCSSKKRELRKKYDSQGCAYYICRVVADHDN